MSGAATRHFLLDRRAGWRPEPLLVDAVEWDDGPVRLRPLPGAPRAVTDASGTFGGLADPIGVAVGPDGTIVVLDAAGARVLRYDACAETFGPLPCLFTDADPCGTEFTLAGARDVAVTCGGDVVVADTGNRRVLVLLGSGLGVRTVAGPWRLDGDHVSLVAPEVTVPAADTCPSRRDWPRGTWEPWGLAAWAGGIVVTDHANGLVHFLNDCGRWRSASDGSTATVGALQKPTAVAVDRHGNVFVLQEGSTHVRVLDSAGAFVAEIDSLDARRRDFCPVTVAVRPGEQQATSASSPATPAQAGSCWGPRRSTRPFGDWRSTRTVTRSRSTATAAASSDSGMPPAIRRRDTS
jgi:hypothetical protein